MMQILRQRVAKVIQLAVIFVLLLFVPALLFVACQVTSLESGSPTNSRMIDHSAFGVTETPAPYVPSPEAYVTSMAQEGDEDGDGLIDFYGNILQAYEDILSDPTLPQATRDMFVVGMATIQAVVTELAIPAPTFDPNEAAIDHKATLEIIWELTATSQPTPIPQFGIIRDEPYAQTTFPYRDDIWIEDAWLGYIEGDTKIRAVRIGSFREGTLDNPTYYGLVHMHGKYMADLLYLTNVPERYLSLISVIDNRYLIMEAFDNDKLGTGEMYYFDMVAREFIAQPTAELLLEPFLHVSVTPTPTAVLTPVTP